jgi:hypothetical protein
LPADAKVIRYYSVGKFSHAHAETTFRIDDEVVILTHSKDIPADIDVQLLRLESGETKESI